MSWDPWSDTEPVARESVEQRLRGSGWTAYALYAGLFVYGGLLLFIGGFAVVVEVTTTVRWTTPAKAAALGAACVTVAHVLFEARNAARLSLVRWIVFVAAVGFMAADPFSIPVTDPLGAVFMSTALGAGGVMIGTARPLLVPRVAGYLRLPLAARLAPVGLVWAPVPVVAVVIVGVRTIIKSDTTRNLYRLVS